MLNRPRHTLPRRAGQRGVVLFVALILLVVLTMAGIAMTRSVSTTNIIAGNLAFQQSATHAADIGVEDAVRWLQANATDAILYANDTANGYIAVRADPAVGQTWDNFFTTTVPQANIKTLLPAATGNVDNTVAYVIHRLCNAPGDPSTVECSAPPRDDACQGNSKQGDAPQFRCLPQVYYRITARVAGPRNTTSMVQAVLAL